MKKEFVRQHKREDVDILKEEKVPKAAERAQKLVAKDK